MSRTIQWLAVLALVVTSLLVRVTSISAHADYDRSEPAKNAVLESPLARIDVWFTQEVFRQQGRNFVRVFNEQNTQVSEGDGIVDDDDRTHISAALAPILPAGRYVVRWMTTSDEDGDTDEGAFCFYIGVQPTGAQAAECAAFEEDGAAPTEAPTGQSPTAQPLTATPPATATISAPEPTTTPEDAGADDDDGGTPIAPIVGGIIGGIVALGAVTGAFIWLRRART